MRAPGTTRIGKCIGRGTRFEIVGRRGLACPGRIWLGWLGSTARGRTYRGESYYKVWSILEGEA